MTIDERVTEWSPLTEAREINATNEVHHGQTAAGANAADLDSIVAKYEVLCNFWEQVVPGRSALALGSAGNCRAPTANGTRTYVSIFFR